MLPAGKIEKERHKLNRDTTIGMVLGALVTLFCVVAKRYWDVADKLDTKEKEELAVLQNEVSALQSHIQEYGRISVEWWCLTCSQNKLLEKKGALEHLRVIIGQKFTRLKNKYPAFGDAEQSLARLRDTVELGNFYLPNRRPEPERRAPILERMKEALDALDAGLTRQRPRN